MDTQWIYQLTAGAAVIFAFLLMLRFLLGKLSSTLDCIKNTMLDIEKSMANRDQIILNHLEHFQQTQQLIIEALEKLCKAWEINGR